MNSSHVKLNDNHLALLYEIINTMHAGADNENTKDEDKVTLLSNASLIVDIVMAIKPIIATSTTHKV